ncbi:hypothetical protein HGRIS_012183 [Hohenbuehelia grisea]|uniref:Uncharacterized protein n=1 Tax=Hohenbuehelia grisea TaxID=104357 RepID=A0ABR3IRJ6_9AGAR
MWCIGNTKSSHRRRSLRMSMIQSAQVFSPRPSHDPRENLRVLKSPLKPFASPTKSSLLRHASHADDDDDLEEQEIVLVDGNHPRVVEEEKDLIILEDIELPDSDQTPTKSVPSHSNGRHAASRTVPSSSSQNSTSKGQATLAPPVPNNPPPQTPQRRARPTLHRAVLIRSAQRAVIRAEVEREEEEEEKEVEEFATQLNSSTSSESASEGDDDDDSEEDEEDEGVVGQAMWAKGLQAVRTKLWPFGSDPSEKDTAEVDLSDSQDDEVEELPTAGGPLRALGNFMTPQASRTSTSLAGRFSVGGAGEARRVPIEPKWRVNDIVVPSQAPTVKQETDHVDQDSTVTSMNSSGVGRGQGRATLSAEERKAIQERRRSALTTPDPFFAGQTPGLRRQPGFPASPTKTPAGSVPVSPLKTAMKQANTFEKVEEDDEEEELDTRSLMERMKETVEAMKRRRSVAPTSGDAEDKASSRKSLGLGLSPRKRTPEIGVTPEPRTPSDKDRRFSLLTPAARKEVFGWDEREVIDVDEDEELAMDVDEDPDVTMRTDTLSVIGDEGKAMAAEKEPSASQPLHNSGLPQTPRMDGMRHMFAPPKPQGTPVFSGMRDLFKPETRGLGTPVYEGLGELMAAPLDDAQDDDIPEESSSTDVADEEAEPIVATKPAASRVPVKKTQTVRISRKNPRSAASQDTPSLADDEATPGNAGTSSEQPDNDVELGETVPVVKTRTSSRKKTPEPTRKLPARSRSRSKTRTQAPEPDISDIPPVPTLKPALRRTTKAAKTAATSDESSAADAPEVVVDAPTKIGAPRGRKPATKTAAVSSTDDQAPPKPVRKGRSTRATPSPQDATEEQSAPSTEAEEQPVAAPKRKTVGTRSKVAVKQTVKEEEVDESPAETDTKRTGRTRVKAPTAIPEPKTRATRTPATRKAATPATIMSNVTDKENTPDPIDVDDDDADRSTKAKVSRTRKPAAKKVKEEVAEAPAPKTRVTRARTRT